jgi:hypothetical protein
MSKASLKLSFEEAERSWMVESATWWASKLLRAFPSAIAEPLETDDKAWIIASDGDIATKLAVSAANDPCAARS